MAKYEFYQLTIGEKDGTHNSMFQCKECGKWLNTTEGRGEVGHGPTYYCLYCKHFKRLGKTRDEIIKYFEEEDKFNEKALKVIERLKKTFKNMEETEEEEEDY